jgi:hypothetical protein
VSVAVEWVVEENKWRVGRDSLAAVEGRQLGEG